MRRDEIIYPNLKGMGSGKKRPHRNTCATPNPERAGTSGKRGGRNTRPRASSVNGIAARAATRLAVYNPNPVGSMPGAFTKPGSLNPRKLRHA